MWLDWTANKLQKVGTFIFLSIRSPENLLLILREKGMSAYSMLEIKYKSNFSLKKKK